MVPEFSHRIKFERACEHLVQLESSISRWLDERPNAVSLEPDPTDSEYQFLKVMLAEIPLNLFSPLIGDVVQNLRASLDHVVHALSVANKGGALTEEETKRTKFTIAETSGEFLNRAGSNLKLISPEARAVIERLQPYNSASEGWRLDQTITGDPLWQLNKMSNSDKHHSLTVTAAVIPCFRMRSHYEAAGASQVGSFRTDGWHSFGRFMENAAPIARLRRTRDADGREVQMDVQGSFDVTLRNPPGRSEGDPIRRVLGDFCVYVEGKVFEPLERFL